MATYEYNKKYVDKYMEKLGEIKIRVPKEDKDRIKAHADRRGESVNAFIVRAIAEAIQRDLEKSED